MSNLIAVNNRHITGMVDNSDFLAKRVLVKFDNGHSLSVVRGRGTYGADNGLFEIAVFDPKGDWVKFDNGDDVLGWQSYTDVIGWVNKVAVM